MSNLSKWFDDDLVGIPATPVTGNTGTSALGAIALSITLALSGNAATGSVGTVTPPAAPVSVAITGNQATGFAGAPVSGSVRFHSAGSGDTLLAASSAIPSGTSLTIMVWAKYLSSTPGGGGVFWVGPFASGDPAWTNGAELFFDTSTPPGQFDLGNLGNENAAMGDWSPDVWTHVCITGTIAVTTGTFEGFVDGVSVGSVGAGTPGGGYVAETLGLGIGDVPADFQLVAYKVWTRTLSGAEIQAERLSIRPVSRTNLYLDVDLTSTSDYGDRAGNPTAHDLSLTRGTTTNATDVPDSLIGPPLDHDFTVAITGNGATGSPGTLGPSMAVAETGNGATGSVGTVQEATAVSGNAATGSPGTTALTFDLASTGLSATGSPGSAAADASFALAGFGVSGSPGSSTVDFSVALSGLSATGSPGTVVASADVTVAVTGNGATGSAGTASPVFSFALDSLSATGAVGDVQEATGITGASGTASPGTASPVITVGLSGTSATGDVGSVAATGAGTASLTGVGGTVSAGDLTLSSVVPATGQSASVSAGSTSGAFTRSADGVEAAGDVGDVAGVLGVEGNGCSGSPGDCGVDATVAVSGVSGTAVVGYVEPIGEQSAALTGVEGTGSAGDVFPAIGGVEATGHVGTLTAHVRNNHHHYSDQNEDGADYTDRNARDGYSDQDGKPSYSEPSGSETYSDQPPLPDGYSEEST